MLPDSPTADTVVAKDFHAAEGVGVNEGDCCLANMRTGSSIVSCSYSVATPTIVVGTSMENIMPDDAPAGAASDEVFSNIASCYLWQLCA